MKTMLILGAMDCEINLIIDKTNAILDKSIYNFDFYIGKFNNFNIIITKTKIGISNASIAATLAVLNYTPNFIINIGTAGAYSDIQRGDIILGKSIININSFEKPYLATGINYKNWILKTFSEDDVENTLLCDENLLKICKNTKYAHGAVHIGVIGSADVWNKEVEFIQFLHKNFNVLCEDMESFAVYNVAKHSNLPVISIRIASNNEILLQEYDKSSAIFVQQFLLDVLSNL